MAAPRHCVRDRPSCFLPLARRPVACRPEIAFDSGRTRSPPTVAGSAPCFEPLARLHLRHLNWPRPSIDISFCDIVPRHRVFASRLADLAIRRCERLTRRPDRSSGCGRRGLTARRRARMIVHGNAKLGPARRVALSPATAHRWCHRRQAAIAEDLRSAAWALDRSSRPHRSPRLLEAGAQQRSERCVSVRAGARGSSRAPTTTPTRPSGSPSPPRHLTRRQAATRRGTPASRAIALVGLPAGVA